MGALDHRGARGTPFLARRLVSVFCSCAAFFLAGQYFLEIYYRRWVYLLLGLRIIAAFALEASTAIYKSLIFQVLTPMDDASSPQYSVVCIVLGQLTLWMV